jgi:hypothetical protein
VQCHHKHHAKKRCSDCKVDRVKTDHITTIITIKYQTRRGMFKWTDGEMVESYLNRRPRVLLKKIRNVCAGYLYRSCNIGCYICDSWSEYWPCVIFGGMTTTHSIEYGFLRTIWTIVFKMALGMGPCSGTTGTIKPSMGLLNQWIKTIATDLSRREKQKILNLLDVWWNGWEDEEVGNAKTLKLMKMTEMVNRMRLVKLNKGYWLQEGN